VNRWTFDRDVREINIRNGVVYHDGGVTDVELNRGRHLVTWQDQDGKRTSCRPGGWSTRAAAIASSARSSG
jgi:hypothetical protein